MESVAPPTDDSRCGDPQAQAQPPLAIPDPNPAILLLRRAASYLIMKQELNHRFVGE